MKIEDYNKYYIQGSDHYLIPKDEFIELFNELEAWKDQTKRDERLIRLVQTEKVFDTIAGIIKEGSCSYRHLIYDKLGFDGGCYEKLIAGMAITNAICDLEDLKVQHEEDLKEMEKLTSIWETKNKEISKLKEEIKAVNKGLRKVRERADKYKNKSLDLQKENQELKKELENAVPVSDFQIVINKVITQQEQFINYLEDEIESTKDTIELMSDIDSYKTLMLELERKFFEEILQKYKEIMEVK